MEYDNLDPLGTFDWLYYIAMAIILFAILAIVVYAFKYYEIDYSNCPTYDNHSYNYSTYNHSINIKNNEDAQTRLQYILKKEISLVNLTNETCQDEYCKCWDYANYYNKTLTEKYPGILDVHWIHYVDVCNNLTLCSDYHTYILVNGFGEECLLDEHTYKCIQLIPVNESK